MAPPIASVHALSVRILAFVLASVVALAAGAQDVPVPPEPGPRGRFTPIRAFLDESGTGDFDAALAIRLLNSRRAAFGSCYERLLREVPEARGRVTVRFTIETTGSVTDATVIENALASPDVATCVVRITRGFRFLPGPEGGPVTYTFALDFEPAT